MEKRIEAGIVKYFILGGSRELVPLDGNRKLENFPSFSDTFFGIASRRASTEGGWSKKGSTLGMRPNDEETMERASTYEGKASQCA